MKTRLSKKDRALVREILVKWLLAMDCDEDTARRAVTHGSPCMADAIGRRIANGPGYAITRTITPEMLNAATVGCICYKCGLRDDAAPVLDDDAGDDAAGEASPVLEEPAPAAAPVFAECSAEAPAVRDLFAD